MLMAEYPNLISVSLMLYRITTCAHLVMINIPDNKIVSHVDIGEGEENYGVLATRKPMP